MVKILKSVAQALAAWWARSSATSASVQRCKTVDMIRAAANELTTAIEDCYDVAWSNDDYPTLDALGDVINRMAEKILDLGDPERGRPI